MKWTRRSVLELLAILVMTAVVAVLAVLQYRWTAQISASEQYRLKTQLDTSVRDFDGEFSYDFERLCEGFEIAPQPASSTFESAVSRQYLNWSKTTSRPGLVGALHIWQPAPAQASHLESFDSQTGKFAVVAWPRNLESLRPFLTQEFARLQPVISDRAAG